jgi:hypothetical protein
MSRLVEAAADGDLQAGSLPKDYAPDAPIRVIDADVPHYRGASPQYGRMDRGTGEHSIQPLLTEGVSILCTYQRNPSCAFAEATISNNTA